MDTYLLILLFTVIFMLHNLEEIMTIEKWFQKVYPRIKGKIPSFAKVEVEKRTNTTSTQFSFVVFLLSIPTAVVILLAIIFDYYFLFLGLNLFFAVNIFSHPLQSLFLRAYTPGLWTSLLLVIPYYCLFFAHLASSGLFTLKNMLAGVLVMLLFVPVFLLSHRAGEKWR